MLLAATGAGVSAAVTKLAMTAAQYARRIKDHLPLVRHLKATSRISDEERSRVVRQLLKGDLDENERRSLEVGVSLTQSIARSPKVRIYNNRREVTDHIIQPGDSYTVVFECE